MAKKRNERGLVPRWEKGQGQLWVGDTLVIEFDRLAPDRQLVLDALHEVGWPARIDSPLRPKHPEDPAYEAHRLRVTLDRLNKGQLVPMLHFTSCNRGQGIRWRFLQNGGRSDAQMRRK